MSSGAACLAEAYPKPLVMPSDSRDISDHFQSGSSVRPIATSDLVALFL